MKIYKNNDMFRIYSILLKNISKSWKELLNINYYKIFNKKSNSKLTNKQNYQHKILSMVREQKQAC